MASFELLFLGTGTSAGIPMIGCDCSVCRSDDPRDQRTRCSALVRYLDAQGEEHDQPFHRQFLIDSAPDIRLQAIRHNLNHLDAVLYTHAHADHIFGIDDLRRFNAVMEAPLDIHAEPDVLQTFDRMFPYIFQPQKNINKSFVARLIPNTLEPAQPLSLFGATWTPIRLMHGRLPVLGFRVDWQNYSLAYCTDVSTIPPESIPLLADLDVLVLDALRYRHHPTHLTVDQALELVDQLQPARTFFTHIAHEIAHADLQPRLPVGVDLAYDGLKVSITDTAAADETSPAGETSDLP